MLVLSRKLNEAIVIDGGIRVTIVGVRGNQVRLGIEAPEQVRIFREELCAGTGTEDDADEMQGSLAPGSFESRPSSTPPGRCVSRWNGPRLLPRGPKARFG